MLTRIGKIQKSLWREKESAIWECNHKWNTSEKKRIFKQI